MAAGNTYVALATTTASGSTGTITFSSIPSTYTDLVLVMNFANSTAAADTRVQFNGDTGTNYSYTYLAGSGSSASSGRASSGTSIQFSNGPTGSTTTNETAIMQIMNYANATTYKTALTRVNVADGAYAGVGANVGLWRSTSAITSLTFTMSTGNLTSSSTFSLYGILAA